MTHHSCSVLILHVPDRKKRVQTEQMSDQIASLSIHPEFWFLYPVLFLHSVSCIIPVLCFLINKHFPDFLLFYLFSNPLHLSLVLQQLVQRRRVLQYFLMWKAASSVLMLSSWYPWGFIIKYTMWNLPGWWEQWWVEKVEAACEPDKKKGDFLFSCCIYFTWFDTW